ncbi:MAG: hypothetical protein R3F31_13700 [Verrucomicrobiales bacterium]
MSATFEVTDELIRGEYRTYFDDSIFFNELKALARLKIHGFTNLLWDYDLIFG